MPVSPIISIYAILVAKVSRQTIYVSLKLLVGSKVIDILALLDSGAGGNFIHHDLAPTIHNPTPLKKPIEAFNVDGTPNKEGMITHYVTADILVNNLQMTLGLLVAGIGKVSLILGFPWLQTWNPDVDWQKGTLRWRHGSPHGRTPIIEDDISGKALGPTSISWLQDKISPGTTPVDDYIHKALTTLASELKICEELAFVCCMEITSSVSMTGSQLPIAEIALDEEESTVGPMNPPWTMEPSVPDYEPETHIRMIEEQESQETWIRSMLDENDEVNVWLQVLETATKQDNFLPTEAEVWIQMKITHSQELAIEHDKKNRQTKTVEEMVLKELHKYLDVFSKTKAARFPTRKPYNHQIDVKPGFKPKRHKLYSLTPEEDALLKTFVDENLSKGYIRPLKSEMASSFFFVAKK